MKCTIRAVITIGMLFSHLSYSQWVDGQNASVVIGQVEFLSGSSATSNTGLKFNSSNGAITIDKSTNKVYVADSDNNRVLRFNYPSGGFSTNQPTAEAVFGQAGFNSGTSGLTATTLNNPSDVFAKNDTLWVADYGNQRVLGFLNASSKSSGASADIVIGQSLFSTSTRSSAANGMGEPAGLAVDDYGSLYVSQYAYGRVMKFPKAALVTGGSATSVFGSLTLTAAGAGGTSAKTFYPWKIATKNNSLFVVDYDYQRVLRFDNIDAVTTDPSAAVVFGASDFTTAGSATATPSSFAQVSAVALDNANRLYVTDYGGSRVLIFSNAFTSSNNANASNVLGQSNFNNSGTNVTQSGLNSPDGVFIDSQNKQVYVCDLGNHRILQFTASSALPVELTSFQAHLNDGDVRLQWTTATETNNHGFEIEKSITTQSSHLQNVTWEKIGFVDGAGTSSSVHQYSFLDHNALGVARYRLKQIDRDGKFEYSNEVEAFTIHPNKLSLDQNYPNPFNPSTMIQYTIGISAHVTLKVYNVLGEEVTTLVNSRQDAGSYSVQFNAVNGAHQLSSGVYFYRLETGQNEKGGGRAFTATKKFILMK